MRRSRRRPFCRFVVAVMAAVFALLSWRSLRRFFFTNVESIRNPASCHVRFSPFIERMCLGFVPLRDACAIKRFFWTKLEKYITKQAKKSPPLVVGGGHIGQRRPALWRSRRSFADTPGGHGPWSSPAAACGGRRPFWRLKRQNRQLASAAGGACGASVVARSARPFFFAG